MTTPPVSWTKGLSNEAGFWNDVLTGRDSRWGDLMTTRFQRRPLNEAHRRLVDLSAHGARDVWILDVGAGPACVMGCEWPDRNVNLVPLDPLADEYAKQLKENGHTVAVPTIKGEAEKLAEQFGRAKFDFVFSHNALDHAYSPLLALCQMIYVAKPEACVQLEHRMNEAEVERYAGLHQWNFCDENGHFIVWNKAARHDVTEIFSKTHEVISRPHGDWLSLCMKPRNPMRPEDYEEILRMSAAFEQEIEKKDATERAAQTGRGMAPGGICGDGVEVKEARFCSSAVRFASALMRSLTVGLFSGSPRNSR